MARHARPNPAAPGAADGQNALDELEALAHVGSWSWDIPTDRVTWSHELHRIFGTQENEMPPTYAAYLAAVHPEDRDRVDRIVRGAFQDGKPFTMDHRILRPDGGIRLVECSGRLQAGPDGRPLRMHGACLDVTEHRNVAAKLAAHAIEVERSNQDLESFAYAASHDLQEPLRVVKGYLDLLAKHAGDRMDDRCKEFVGAATDGTVRMQRLIDDLLQYSRVGTRGGEPTEILADAALDSALVNLGMALRESKAHIEREPLPVVRADGTQLAQLFQNLVGNAVKFRNAAPLVVQVGARRVGPDWEFFVRDNGIGIAPKDHKRLFNIFQRLHGEEIPGTGIGLALCKRIVERHGGRIWVESEAGHGATFRFTLPAGRPA